MPKEKKMTLMTKPATLAAFVTLLLVTGSVWAGSLGHTAMGHGDATMESNGDSAGAAADSSEVRAEVRRVNTRDGTISLRHEAIPNLDMPPMSMTFGIEDPAWLEGLERGAEVLVVIDRVDGEYVVKSLRLAD